MKTFVVLVLLAVTANFAYGSQMKCSVDGSPDAVQGWRDMRSSDCLTAVRAQIQKEFDASYQYLQMGAHFSRDVINRPGFADMFFKAAKEERDHGSKLIEYLLMRGELIDDVTSLVTFPPKLENNKLKLELTTKWQSGVAALRKALELEIQVTESIRGLIKTCENGHNYYHLVDYLTGVYLEEQLHGQRDLAGKLSTLQKMMTNHGALGEFLFDKNL